MGIARRSARNVARTKVRTFLVVLALGFSIATIVSVYSGIEAQRDKTQGMIDDYSNFLEDSMQTSATQQLRVSIGSSMGGGGWGGSGGGGPGGGGGTTETVIVTQAMVDSITAMSYVQNVIPKITKSFGEIEVEMEEPPGGFGGGGPGGDDTGGTRTRTMSAYTINGVPLDASLDAKYVLLPSDFISGRNLNDGDTGNVVISETLVDYFDVSTGGKVSLEGYNFTVVGVFSNESRMSQRNIYMSLPDARKVAGLGTGEYLGLDAYASSEDTVDLVVSEIEEAYPTYRVMAYKDMSAMFADRMSQQQQQQIDQLEGNMDEVQQSGNQIIVILLITATMIVLFMMSYAVRERTKEIGTLKAIGFTSGDIMAQFVLEGTLIGILGGVIGIVIAGVAAPMLSDTLLPDNKTTETSGQRGFFPGQANTQDDTSVTASVSPLLAVMAFGLAVMLGGLGSLYPAWTASRKSPVEAMRHE